MCPLCKSDTYILVGPAKTEYKVVQCKSCSFYYVMPEIIFSSEEWKYLYDGKYFAGMTEWHSNERSRQRNLRMNSLERYTGRKVKNFLDVGCGEGYMLVNAHKRGWIPFGIDISDNRVAEAKAENITFINSDLLNARFPGNFFDAIYMDSVLEHVTNPMESLKELNRIMAPGGILYIGIPNEDSLVNDVRQLIYNISGKKVSARLRPFETPYHVSGFNKKSIKFAISKASLKTVKLRNFAARLSFLQDKFLSKNFIVDSILFPVNLLAVLLRREVYFEAYLQK
jgi:ubiquinone/menaquinone biosynthesis C-methylase UbiE